MLSPPFNKLRKQILERYSSLPKDTQLVGTTPKHTLLAMVCLMGEPEAEVKSQELLSSFRNPQAICMFTHIRFYTLAYAKLIPYSCFATFQNTGMARGRGIFLKNELIPWPAALPKVIANLLQKVGLRQV